MKQQVKFFIYDTQRTGFNTYELFKYLFNEGHNCHLVNWTQSYSLEEMIDMDHSTDIWVTSPSAIPILVNDYKISAYKCVAIANTYDELHSLTPEVLQQLHGFGCTSSLMVKYTKEDLCLPVIPKLCRYGINHDSFTASPTPELSNIAYLTNPPYDNNTDVSPLVFACAAKLNLPVLTLDHVKHNYVAFPTFYKGVSCVIAPNTSYINEIPIMEAAASGTLIIGSVDHTTNIIQECGGITIQAEGQEFIDQTVDIISNFRSNQLIFKEKCMHIKNKSYVFDWKHSASDWSEILY